MFFHFFVKKLKSHQNLLKTKANDCYKIILIYVYASFRKKASTCIISTQKMQKYHQMCIIMNVDRLFSKISFTYKKSSMMKYFVISKWYQEGITFGLVYF